MTGPAVARELSPAAVREVYGLIGPHVRRTPLISVDLADFGLAPGPLVLKLEMLQHAGSFKTRGAFANLLLQDVPAAGVVAASGGNHGAAVAYAAGKLGVPARIFVPEVSSPAKVARIRSYGADLVVSGAAYTEAFALSQEWERSSGALRVHAYDTPETVLGAGSVGAELSDQAGGELDTVLAGVGGGGLLSGICTALSFGALGGERGGSVRVVGVELEGAPTLTYALKAGEPVDAPVGSVAVDSLAPRQAGVLTYQVISGYPASMVLVSDDDITGAQQLLWDRFRLVGEPGGCAALAAVLSGRYVPAPGERVAVVISGANTTAVDFSRQAV
jgi:threonine dehydratase